MKFSFDGAKLRVIEFWSIAKPDTIDPLLGTSDKRVHGSHLSEQEPSKFFRWHRTVWIWNESIEPSSEHCRN